MQVQQYARALVRRLLGDSTASEVDTIGRGYRLALGRPPVAEEIADAHEFLKSQRESYAAAEKAVADKAGGRHGPRYREQDRGNRQRQEREQEREHGSRTGPGRFLPGAVLPE